MARPFFLFGTAVFIFGTLIGGKDLPKTPGDAYGDLWVTIIFAALSTAFVERLIRWMNEEPIAAERFRDTPR